jgi:hypothetical protein
MAKTLFQKLGLTTVDPAQEAAEQAAAASIKNSKSCGCDLTHLFRGGKSVNWKGTGEMSGTYLSRIKRNANNRGLEFSVSSEYLWKLFQKQNGNCALTGERLVFRSSYNVKYKKEQTASLDRINSSKGYVKGNLQWVHRQVNEMKMNKSDGELIEWCKKIVKHQKQK